MWHKGYRRDSYVIPRGILENVDYVFFCFWEYDVVQHMQLLEGEGLWVRSENPVVAM
jgi:hypothetical protein